MVQNKKFRMPAGIRNKLVAAVAMLLVSSILMVTTTYAWFTLSTAPEVTGITTSVGANGNLEMALLDTNTFDSLDIKTGVGQSSAAQGVVEANKTWGNLVDLDEADYGLQYINLNPAQLNFGADNNVVTESPLLTATYGKDGRVNTVDGETYTAVYDNGWAYDSENQTYGVRAIGSNDNMTAQQAGLISAKTAYSTYLKQAKSNVQGALSNNGSLLADALMALTMQENGSLTTDQQTAITALVNATDTALNNIDAAYKQALLAYAASAIGDETLYNSIVTEINKAATCSDAVTAITNLVSDANTKLGEESKITFTVPEKLTSALAGLNTQKTNVSNAKDKLEQTQPDYKAALGVLVDTDKISINGFEMEDTDNNINNNLWVTNEGGKKELNSDLTSSIINGGGVNVAMPDGSGVFAYVGSVAGNYTANCTVNVKYGGMNIPGVKATIKTTATEDTALGGAVNGMTAATSTGGATYLSETYGYALDFAFRTNASGSYLKLQTAAAQRVYGDSESAATQGSGSNMTFKMDEGLTDDNMKKLMGAIRVAFIDPKEGTLYGIAVLDNIDVGADGVTGELALKPYTIDAGILTVGEWDKGATKTDYLLSLPQNTATRLTVIVYLDGNIVDNSMVANAMQSMTGSMNLQFSSSADLVPMQNTALNNMEITYTEPDTDNDYKAGLYNYGGNLYSVATGYGIYNGSDGLTYFSNDKTNYTKLTGMNYSTVLTPVELSINGNHSGTVGGSIVLTVSTNKGMILTTTWTTDNESVATVNNGTVTLNAGGTAKITATAKVQFTYMDSNNAEQTLTKTLTATYLIVVEAAQTGSTGE